MTTATGWVGLALSHGAVNGLAVIRTVRDHRGKGTGDLIEQGADLGGVARLVARQLGREDLAGAGINGQMKLTPGPLAARTVLLHQPLARAVDLQPSRVDHDVNRPPTRLGSRQRRSERQVRAAPGKRGVVRYTDAHPEQGRERAQQAFGLPPRTTKSQAQQVPGFDRHVRVAARTPPLTRAGRMPSRKRLGRDPDCEAVPLLECPVVLRPVADLVARPRDLVTARLMDLVGHRSSGERGDGPIHSTVVLPKPEAVILHQRHVNPDEKTVARYQGQLREYLVNMGALEGVLVFLSLVPPLVVPVRIFTGAEIDWSVSETSPSVEVMRHRAANIA